VGSWLFAVEFFFDKIAHECGQRFLARHSFAFGEVMKSGWKDDWTAVGFGFGFELHIKWETEGF